MKRRKRYKTRTGVSRIALYWGHDEPTYEPKALDYSDDTRYRQHPKKDRG